jgi:MacB-like periplasmic core domain
MSNLHYAIRGMLRNPGFWLLACLSLAIGIGANTAIYSVIDAVLLRPLPYVTDTTRLAGIVSDVVSYPLYRDIRDRAPSVESVAGFTYRSMTLTGRGPATLARAGVVSGNFFATLGTGAVSGCVLLSSDDTPGADVAVAVNHVATTNVSPQLQRYTGTRTQRVFAEARARILQDLRVRGASWTAWLPLSGERSMESVIVDGYERPKGEPRAVRFDAVGPGYFGAMGIPIRAGREFAETDRGGTPLGAGAVAGLLAAAIAARLIAGFLQGISPLDPGAFGVTAIAILIIAVAATCIPLHRAMTVDPNVALRSE